MIIVCMQLPWVDLFKQAHLIPWLRQRPALSPSGLVGAEYGWEKNTYVYIYIYIFIYIYMYIL